MDYINYNHSFSLTTNTSEADSKDKTFKELSNEKQQLYI